MFIIYVNFCPTMCNFTKNSFKFSLFQKKVSMIRSFGYVILVKKYYFDYQKLINKMLNDRWFASECKKK